MASATPSHPQLVRGVEAAGADGAIAMQRLWFPLGEKGAAACGRQTNPLRPRTGALTKAPIGGTLATAPANVYPFNYGPGRPQ